MTRLESAINYFTKKNQNPTGTLQKINAYSTAEKCLKDMHSIMQIFGEIQQDMISTDTACSKIASIIRG